MDLLPHLLLPLGLALGLVLGAVLGVLWSRSRTAPGVTDALEQRAADQAVVRDGLDRLADQLHDLARDRVTWQARLDQQVSDMRLTSESLRRETQSLSTALRRPQVRGRWGELHLRRAVELAGMVAHCDFTEQEQLADGRLRPDLVVHLAGGRQVVVDAKVPLEGFLDACATDDDEEREHHLRRHARQLRNHVDALGAKSYWKELAESPELVVLFVPAEAFLAAALETQSDLIEHAAGRQVVLATPTTLIALLRTIAHGWSHERLADQAAEVQRLGRELHERLSTMGGHLDRVGRALDSAVGAYNQAVGSLEGRVLVSARRFTELGVTSEPLAEPRQAQSVARSLAAPELAALDEDPDPLDDRTLDRLADRPTTPPARRAEGA